MQVIAGERAVTIRVSYELADWIKSVLPINSDLRRLIAEKVSESKCKGRPFPPLPKGQVAHNSAVEIVE